MIKPPSGQDDLLEETLYVGDVSTVVPPPLEGTSGKPTSSLGVSGIGAIGLIGWVSYGSPPGVLIFCSVIVHLPIFLTKFVLTPVSGLFFLRETKKVSGGSSCWLYNIWTSIFF